MSVSRISKALGYVDDELVSGAIEYKSTKKRNTWVKWGAIAACLCLIVAAVPLISGVLHHKVGEDDPMKQIIAYEHNGAFYECIDDHNGSDVRKRYGLPETITPAEAGEHLGWLEKDKTGYKDCSHETDIELYSYAPHPCVGVLIIRDGTYRDGDHYSAAIFCNHILYGNSCVEFEEIYRVYGVEKAEDIMSVCEFNGVTFFEKITNFTTDRDVLNAFYNATLSLDCYGNDDFQDLEFGSFKSEEAQVAHHKEYADASTTMRIETTSGLVFFVRANPTYGWMEGDLSYFRFNDAMTQWFVDNIK